MATPPPSAASSYNDYTRDLWNDYYVRFRPVEDSILQYNPDKERATAFRGIDRSVGSSFTAAEGVLRRQRSRIGAEADGSQLASEGRRLGLGRVLASVDAKNRASQAIRDTAKNSRTLAFDQDAFLSDMAGGLFRQGAQMENEREVEYQNAKARYKGGLFGAIGKLIGVAAAPFTGGASLGLTALGGG